MLKSLRKLALALCLAGVAPATLVACDDVSSSVDDVTERQGKFEIFEGQDGQHYFRLLAGNGEIILQSEGYVQKAGAEGGIASVKVNGVDPSRYDVLENTAGEYYFNLKARNGEIIGTSESYASKSNAERGVETVVRVVEGLVQLPPDEGVREAIEKGAEDAWYGAIHGSESDYEFTYVEADLQPGETITLDLIREKFADHVAGIPDADGPLAELFGEEKADWETVGEICADPEEAEFNGYTQDCVELTELDAAISANLTDVKAYWFGSEGSPGSVQGVSIVIFIVGKTPDGNLAGVQTITVWT